MKESSESSSFIKTEDEFAVDDRGYASNIRESKDRLDRRFNSLSELLSKKYKGKKSKNYCPVEEVET